MKQKRERENKRKYNHQAVYIIEKNEAGKKLLIYQVSQCESGKNPDLEIK